jgi:predicted secreted protein
MSLKRISLGVCLLTPAFLAIVGLLPGCGAAASADRTSAPATQTDISKEGVYQSGLWRYEASVSNRGSKSEGYHGALLYNGDVLPEPAAVNDYYQTPWGPMYWVGNPVLLWGSHGWMPSPQGREPAGKALPVPTAGQKLVVCAEVLAAEGLATPDRLETRAWVLADLKGFGVKQGHVQCDWLHLGKEPVTIHDTKRWGTAQMRLAETGADKPFTVEIIGRGTLLMTPPKQDSTPAGSTPPALSPKATQTVELPRQAGATRLVKYALQGLPFDEALELYLAFRVEDLGRILVVGPEADGKTVPVKDVDTVLIRLPGDTAKNSVWSVKSVRGKAVEALGGVEYEEDPANAFGVSLSGTFKAFFRVQQKGRTTVALECRPLTEEAKAANKSFKVTLNVQATAAKSSGPQAAEPASGSRASRR